MGKAMRKIGDWKKVMKIARHMPEVVNASLHKSLKQVGTTAEGMAVTFLVDQFPPDWKPLNEEYKKRKIKKKLSSKTLISSSTYMGAITSRVRGGEGFAGVLRKKRNKEGDIVADIARIHEFGSKDGKIPRRRLWFYVLIAMRKYMKRSKIFENNMLDDIRAAGGNV